MKKKLLLVGTVVFASWIPNAFADDAAPAAKPSIIQQAKKDSAALPDSDGVERGGATGLIVVDKTARKLGSGIKDGAEDTGHAIKVGAEDTGHAIKVGAEAVAGETVVVFDATGNEIKKGAEATKEYAKSVNARAGQLPNSDTFERGGLKVIIPMDDAGRAVGRMFKKIAKSIRNGAVDLGEGTVEVFDDAKGGVKKHLTNAKNGTEAFLVVKTDGTEQWIIKAKTGTKNFFGRIGHFFNVAAHPYAKQKTAPCDIPKEIVSAPEGNVAGAESDQSVNSEKPLTLPPSAQHDSAKADASAGSAQ